MKNAELIDQLKKYPLDYPVKLGRSKRARLVRSVHGNTGDSSVRIESKKIR